MERQYLTMPEVASAYGFAEETLRYWRARGEGPPAFKLGRRVYYDRSDLNAWIEREKRAQLGGVG